VPDDLDLRVRLAAFAFLGREAARNGGVFPAAVLREGFEFEGQHVRLTGPQGIFKPAILPDFPISITTAPIREGRPRPYDDGFDRDGTRLFYRYRGEDPMHHENVGLRGLIKARRPLIYFHGIVKGADIAAWPAFVVDDDPKRLCFIVQLETADVGAAISDLPDDAEAPIRRRYATREVRVRLHQEAFRARVLRAYRQRCALCRLRYETLLDAAHITADADPMGEPQVSNGIALCKLHHAAFDQDFLGIRPDHVVEIRLDVLRERDGPMLLHGLQQLHGARIWTPGRAGWDPDRVRLEERYERFRSAR